MRLVLSGEQPKLERLFFNALSKTVKKKHKEPKGDARDGLYCPKTKPGMSWSHTKNKKEEEENE